MLVGTLIEDYFAMVGRKCAQLEPSGFTSEERIILSDLKRTVFRGFARECGFGAAGLELNCQAGRLDRWLDLGFMLPIQAQCGCRRNSEIDGI